MNSLELYIYSHKSQVYQINHSNKLSLFLYCTVGIHENWTRLIGHVLYHNNYAIVLY